MVRPWALSAPIAVLLICLPLLRPLRHPASVGISDSEQATLATIQAIVEQHTLAINQTLYPGAHDVIIRNNWRVYSDQSPVMAVLLSGPYWVMHRWGIRFERDPVLTEYLLTVLGVTLPVAFAAGLLYRMARLFELKRPYRAMFALMIVVGSGWISYATVLNSGAAAAALVVAGAACLVRATLTARRAGAILWTTAAGLLLSLATTYELTALVFLVLMIVVIAVFRWPIAPRVIAIGLYIVGAAIPIGLYARLNRAITGDYKPACMHPELAMDSPGVDDANYPDDGELSADDPSQRPSIWHNTVEGIGRAVGAMIGTHGVLSHFPVIVMGILGVTMVMHRHWPAMTKVLAGATLAAAIVIIVAYSAKPWQWKDPMFANRWFVVFLPMMLFWSGAWFRRSHRRSSWLAAGSLFAFSAMVALIGAVNPQPPKGYVGYSAVGAARHLLQPTAVASRADLLAEQ